MLVGRIRPVETRSVDVEGASLEALSAAVRAELTAGWVVTDIPAAMPKGSQLLTSTATMARRDGVEQIEADDMAALQARVPEGWQLLGVYAL